MLDMRLTDEMALRCEALFDRVAATPIGPNAHALKVALAECAALEQAAKHPYLICKLRDLRHWLRMAYGDTLHGYPPDALRRIVLDALSALGRVFRGEKQALGA